MCPGSCGQRCSWWGACAPLWPRARGRLLPDRKANTPLSAASASARGSQGTKARWAEEPGGCLDGPARGGGWGCTGVGDGGLWRGRSWGSLASVPPCHPSPAPTWPSARSPSPGSQRDVASLLSPPSGLRAPPMGPGWGPPERRDLRGWPGGALLWSSVARLCRRPSRPAVPGAAELHACFLPLPLTQPHFLSASQPPGSSSPACILSTRHPPGPRASVPHPGTCAPLETPCSLQAGPFSSEHRSPGLSVISRPAGDPVMTTPFLLDPPRWDLTLQDHFLLAPSLLMHSQLSAYSGLLYCPGQ